MIRTLLAFLKPLARIATELRIIRELYEADLAARPQPIYRQTETPSPRDTEVSYAGIEDKRPAYKRWFQAGEDEPAGDGE